MSKQIFFVTGYPRSRTAWLATLLTWGNCFCFHDGLANIESLDELDEKFKRVPGNIVGNSDPANLLFHDALMRRYPDAKWIVVERPVKQAAVSFYLASGLTMAESVLTEKMQSLGQMIPCNLIMHVSFDQLNAIGTLVKLTDFIGVNMPIQRYYELHRLNIKIVPSLAKVPLTTIQKMKRLQASINHECVLA